MVDIEPTLEERLIIAQQVVAELDSAYEKGKELARGNAGALREGFLSQVNGSRLRREQDKDARAIKANIAVSRRLENSAKLPKDK